MNSEPNSALRHYQGAAGEEYHGGKRGVPAVAVPWIAAARAELFKDHVAPGHEVLEFGAGAGWNLQALSCRRRVGHDIAPSVREPLELAGIEFCPNTSILPERSFDRVICHHALEHLLAPPAALREMHRLLRSDGRLLVTVPFEEGRRVRQYEPAEPNHHLYSWNPQTLGNLLTECAFTVNGIGLRPYGYDRFAADLAVRWHGDQFSFRFLRAIARILRPIEEVFAVAAPR